MRELFKSGLAIAVMSLAAGHAAMAAEQSSNKIQLNIPAQPMGDALNQFGQQSGLIVMMYSSLGQGVKSPPLTGSYTTVQALEQLLADTGLVYEFIDQRTVAIRPQKPTASNGATKISTFDGADEGSESLRWVSDSRLVQAQEQSSPVSAQSSSDIAEDESVKLEEVVVTARKVSERLQDVPIAVTAVGAEQLENAGAIDIKDVIGSVPGLAYTNPERGQSFYSIRGVAMQGTESPTVGIYLDDIPVTTVASAFTGGLDPILFDIERIEVLRGPQGTLYGGNAMGGAIKYVSASPDLSGRSASVASGVASTEHGDLSYNVEGVLNVPLSPTLAVRAGVLYQREGGYVDNIADGVLMRRDISTTAYPVYTPQEMSSLSTRNAEDQNYADSYAGRLSVLWRPDSTFEANLRLHYQDYELANTPSYFANQAPLTSSFRLPEPTIDTAGIASLELEKDFGGVTLTSLTGYLDRNVDWYRDYSFLVGSIIAPTYPLNSPNFSTTATTQLSQEFRLQSSGDADTRFRWLLGAYASHQKDNFYQLVEVDGSTSLWSTLEIPAFLFPGGVYGDTGFVGEAGRKIDQFALFGEASFRITDALEATAGVRYYENEEEVYSIADGLFNGGATAQTGSASEDGFNPKVGLSYRLDEDHLLYGSAARGFRPGAALRFSIPLANCAASLANLGYSEIPQSYESDSIWTYEAGSKNEFDDGRAVFNAAVFRTEWSNIQQSIGLACGFSFFDNVGTAVVQGAEVESRFRLGSNFEVGANVSYLDSFIDEAAPGTPAVNGDQVQGVPEWAASTFISYTTPLGSAWELNVRGDYSYRGEALASFAETRAVTFTNGTFNIPNEQQHYEAWDVVNAYALFTHGGFGIRAYVNNAFDNAPELSASYRGDYTNRTIRPRTIGVELRRQF